MSTTKRPKPSWLKGLTTKDYEHFRRALARYGKTKGVKLQIDHTHRQLIVHHTEFMMGFPGYPTVYFSFFSFLN
ncbi:MAG: hypothetical protein ACFFDI_20245 [Promethearchaeota archaeon]